MKRFRKRNEHYVLCRWDDEASVWYVYESTIPGLRADAETLDEMQGKVRAMAIDLLSEYNPEDNHPPHSIPFRFEYEENLSVSAC